VDRAEKNWLDGSVTGLAASCALLIVPIAAVATLTAAVSNHGFSTRAFTVASVAGFVCWLSAALALVVTFFSSRIGAAVQGVLLAMLVRMGLPLAALIALPGASSELSTGRFSTTLVITYLVALTVETLLALRLVPATAMKPT
jgi:hypothetical protein